MFEIGDTLREARVRRGLSLKDVEDTLKVRSKYLQALEQDDFEVIPGPTFVKAFLRTYAVYLGLDAEQMVGEYVTRFAPDHAEPLRAARPTKAGRAHASPRPPTLAAGRTRGGRRRQPNFLLVGAVAVVIIVILALVFRDRGEEPAVIEPEAVTTTTSALESETSTTTAATVETPVSGEAADAPLPLIVRAENGPSWLVVKPISSSVITLFSGTLAQGEELSFEEPGGYRLSVGAPSAILLVVDGAEVTVPEPYGVFTLTRAGLERVP